MPKFRKLLKNKNFVLYSVGQAFSQFGDRLVQIILIGFVYSRWPGSTLQLAKIFLFTVLPSFFLSPIAGVYVDRWNKKHIMMISDLMRAVVVLLVPIFFIHSESIAPIYASIFFIFAFACFFLPARLAIIPSLVSKEDLLVANSASSITWVASGIAGFTFGGFLAEYAGIKNSLYVNSFVYFLSAVSFLFLMFSMRKNKIESDKKEGKLDLKKIIEKSFFQDLTEGLKTIVHNKKIRFVAYVFFILSSLVGAFYVIVVVFVQETLQSMTKDIGIFGMCLFAGVLVGSYLFGKIGEKLPRTKTVFASLLMTGLFIDLFAVALKVMKSFWMGSVAVCLLGFFIAPIYVTANTMIHESSKHGLGGRIFSSMGIIMNLGFLLFMFLSSILAEHIDRFWILVACGTGFSIVGIVSMMTGFLEELTSSSTS